MPRVIDGSGVVVDGDGVRTTAAIRIIDSYERNSSGPGSQYDGQVDEFSIVDDSTLGFDAIDGSRVLRNAAGQGFSAITSTSGLPHYFAKGEVARVYWRTNDLDGEVRIGFAVEDTANYYIASYSTGSQAWRLRKLSDGSLTNIAEQTGVSASADTWYEIEMVRDDGTLGGSDNDLTVSIRPVGGSQLASVSSNDSEYASADGIGLVGQTNSTADYYWDFYHK